jgi:GT2 family glycosyltransferase
MLSIIIPVYNQHEMTFECIEAIRLCTTSIDYEIVLVDNGSEPPIKVPYTGFVEMKLIRNEENRGFPAAVNQGINKASGDIIVLLNNDVIVTPGWLVGLFNWLNEFSIVGPVTNYCAGLQKVSIPVYKNTDELNKEAGFYRQENAGRIEEVNWIIGFCMVFKKSLCDEIGHFDESLWPCCGEEIDFCLRARSAGYRVGIAHDVYVHHFGSQTFNAMNLDYNEICNRNDKHLAEKWGKDFWQRQAIDASPDPHGVALNLGCGLTKLDGFINIDNRAEVDPDVVCDVQHGIRYPDNSVDLIRADDFLEHIEQWRVIDVMNEIWRVLKPGGILDAKVPSTDGRGAFQDPTHLSYWNCNSWYYFSDPDCRKLYGIKADFEIESIKDSEPDALMIIHTHVIARARK